MPPACAVDLAMPPNQASPRVDPTPCLASHWWEWKSRLICVRLPVPSPALKENKITCVTPESQLRTLQRGTWPVGEGRQTDGARIIPVLQLRHNVRYTLLSTAGDGLHPEVLQTLAVSSWGILSLLYRSPHSPLWAMSVVFLPPCYCIAIQSSMLDFLGAAPFPGPRLMCHVLLINKLFVDIEDGDFMAT